MRPLSGHLKGNQEYNTSSLLADQQMRCPTLNELPPPPPGRSGWPWTEEGTPLPNTMPDGSPWPRISIVTPSYNQRQFIEETIRSVLLQGYPNLEYIIIDGGSADGSVEIIKGYEKFLSYWVSEPDQGQADAINKGFLKSTGDILAWQNSDDIYLPNAFFSAVEGFRNNPGASLVFGNIKLIDQESRERGELRFVPFSRWALILEGTMLANQAAFWKRELFFLAGILNPSLTFCMDYEFFLRASSHGRFEFIRQFLGAFRHHCESKSTVMHQVGMQEHTQILRELGVVGNGSKKRQGQKVISILRRGLYYALQGDLTYLFRGALTRARSTTHEE
jgi:glycosyltransferase involved in cell wall biosynthesis